MAGTPKNKQQNVVVEAQGHFLKLSIKQPGVVNRPRLRGFVSDFSRASRKRMLEKIARIDERKAGFICFVTLTYPDRDGPPSAKETERDREVFLKRIKRAHPNASGVWRREWEFRLTGEFAGVFFPHYHLIVFGLPFIHHTIVNEIWSEVIGYEGYLRTEIKGLENWRHAFFYVCKYMAKVPTWNVLPPGPAGAGKAPEEGSPAPAGPGGAAACSLVYVSNLTEDKKQVPRSIGRSWGVFNRSKVPFAERRELLLKSGPWLEEAKKMARQVWSGVNDDPQCGFTLFLDDAPAWLHDIGALGEDNPLQFDENGEYDPNPVEWRKASEDRKYEGGRNEP